MPRRSDVNWAAVTMAAPYGNIRRADLRALGVADSTIAGRTRTGMWVLSLPGLIRLTTGTPTEDELLDVALRYAGDDAVVSGTTAVRRHGLRQVPDDGWNRAIHTEDGRRLFTPDGWVDEVAMAWELESVEYHLSPEDQERSYRRAALMRRYDVELVEHRPSQLRREHDQVCEDLWIAYRRALRRPRPPLVARVVV